MRGGVEQHHLIDPRTGRPAGSRWDEVTVAASSCLSADIAARAAVLLSDDGPGWLDERGLPGRFLAGGQAFENDARDRRSHRVAAASRCGRPGAGPVRFAAPIAALLVADLALFLDLGVAR